MISRGHLMLVALDGRLVAIDVASTNGSYVVTETGQFERRRCFEVSDGTVFMIGTNLVQARWSIQVMVTPP